MKTLGDYLAVCGDAALGSTGDLATPIARLVVDSRQVQPGDLFVGIEGAEFDGRRFIPQAIARGAAAVAGKPALPPDLAVPALLLRDDYVAANRMAELSCGCPARRLTLGTVTGTKGKTTIAFLMQDMLRASHRETGMIGTVRYEYAGCQRPADRTTPTGLELQALFRQMVEAGVTHVAMEVSSHALAQQRLGAAQVAAAIFTNLSQDHGDFHPTMEDYYLAKRRLFTTHLAPGGTAIVNLDSDFGARLHQELATLRPDVTRLTFAVRQPADLAVHSCQGSINGARLVLSVLGERVACQSPLTGDFNVSNVLGALGGALALGVPLPTAIGAIERFTGVPGRLERLPARHGINIFVDYAHCPDALTNVLSTLAVYRTGRLIVVFGCGGDRDRRKRRLMAAEAARFADLTIVTSDNPRTEDPEKILDDIVAGFTPGQPWRRICDRREAIFAAVAEARPGDTIVLAGKGHEDYQEIHGKHYRFLDREVAADALRQFDLLAEAPES